MKDPFQHEEEVQLYSILNKYQLSEICASEYPAAQVFPTGCDHLNIYRVINNSWVFIDASESH